MCCAESSEPEKHLTPRTGIGLMVQKICPRTRIGLMVPQGTCPEKDLEQASVCINSPLS